MFEKDKTWTMDEATILDELHSTDKPSDTWGYIGIALIVGSPYIPTYFPAFAPYMILSIIIGFAILLAPNILKYKEIAGNVYFGSETYIGEDDIYEQFAVKDIIEVSSAAEPFPFAEHCYEEEDITKFIHSVGGKALISPSEISKRIDIEIAKKAAEREHDPSLKRVLKAKWKKFREKKKDTKEYHLEDSEDGGSIVVESGDDEDV